MRRTMGIVLGISWIFVSVACAGSEANRQEEAEVQEEPPEKEPEGEVPEGPEVKVDGDVEGAESPGRASEEEKQGATSPAGETGSREGATVTKEEIRTFRKKGPSYVFRVVKLEPYRVDGDFEGYEIVGAASEAKEVMSPQVEVGDVVTHVNGVRIARPKHYMKVWKKLDDVDRVRVRLEREGDERFAVWRVVDE